MRSMDISTSDHQPSGAAASPEGAAVSAGVAVGVTVGMGCAIRSTTVQVGVLVAPVSEFTDVAMYCPTAAEGTMMMPTGLLEQLRVV